MKIRLIGLPSECEAAVQLLRQVLDVVSVSAAYATRGRSREIRVYVEARLPQERKGAREQGSEFLEGAPLGAPLQGGTR